MFLWLYTRSKSLSLSSSLLKNPIKKINNTNSTYENNITKHIKTYTHYFKYCLENIILSNNLIAMLPKQKY